MSKKEIRTAITAAFPEAKVRFIGGLAEVTNWREIEGGKYNARYTGKADFYEKLRAADLVDFVTVGA